MQKTAVFGILGGDRRQIYLARSLAADGNRVYIGCMENGDTDGLSISEPQELVKRCDVIILPLPATRDGKYLNCPLAASRVALNDDFAKGFLGKRVFAGMSEKLYESSALWKNVAVFDYFAREELAVGNAFMTAEGAIGMAVCEYEGTINGSHCLVTGFGRIGKALCLLLRGLGARVDCCARKAEDMTAASCMGCRALRYSEVDERYDIIFNTVPTTVLDERLLSYQDKDTLIAELASYPGGVDTAAAKRLGLRVLELPSLPGRFSPKTAGELVKETVYNMLREAEL